MTITRRILSGALACSIGLSVLPAPAASAAKEAARPAAATPRDGSHDFDFNLGVWKSHIKRNLHPMTERTDFVELNGTVSVRAVWGGRAQLEEIEADGPGGHWEGLTLFLYNPQAGQWSQTFANSAIGTLSSALTGGWVDGSVVLYSQDTLDGRFILVRGTWSEITATSHRYQEDYSGDGGRTWEPVFDARLERRNADAS